MGVTINVNSLEQYNTMFEICNKRSLIIDNVIYGQITVTDIIMVGDNHDYRYRVILSLIDNEKDLNDMKLSEELLKESKESYVKILQNEDPLKIFELYDEYLEIYRQAMRNQYPVPFPCKVEIMPNSIYNKKNPWELGVKVLSGRVNLGVMLKTISLSINDKKTLYGQVQSIRELDSNAYLNQAISGQEICIKWACDDNYKSPRDFDCGSVLTSSLGQTQIEILEKYYDLNPDEQELIKLL
jgi:translation initiation factor 5B